MDDFRDLYVEKDNMKAVFRVFDPVAGKYCRSGRGLYGRPRSEWGSRSGATQALKSMPKEIQDRLVIKKFILQEVRELIE